MPKPNRNKIIYGIATAWLALGMLSTGAGQIIKMKEGQGALDMMVHLGYPEYLLTLLGVWKILGVVAVLMPARRLFVNLLKSGPMQVSFLPCPGRYFPIWHRAIQWPVPFRPCCCLPLRLCPGILAR